MGRNDEGKSQSCCTWIKIGAVAVALIVAGILIWQYAPINKAIDSVIPTFNNTGSTGSSDIGGSGNASSPTPSPVAENLYEFMKCADPTSSGCCNGLDNGFCDLRVDQVMYATSHNANADFESGFLFSPNHQYRLEDSLPAGYRAINVDICNCGGQLVFCHGICSFGTRDPLEVFLGINDFLNANPTEVLILPIEINSDVDQPVDLDEFYGVMQQAPGFVDLFYIHPNITDPWPTLGELVETNKRVIVFQSRGPACDDTNICPPGFHQYSDYAVDTQWNLDSLDTVANSNFSCTFTETPGQYGTTFFGLNNFIITPSQSVAETMNAYDYASNRIDTCSSFNGNLEVNFIYSDFWNVGDIPRLVQDRNAAMAQRRNLELAGET